MLILSRPVFILFTYIWKAWTKILTNHFVLCIRVFSCFHLTFSMVGALLPQNFQVGTWEKTHEFPFSFNFLLSFFSSSVSPFHVSFFLLLSVSSYLNVFLSDYPGKVGTWHLPPDKSTECPKILSEIIVTHKAYLFA